MSDVTVAMCHKLSGVSTYGLMVKGREMSTLPTFLQRGIVQFIFMFRTKTSSLCPHCDGSRTGSRLQSVLTKCTRLQSCVGQSQVHQNGDFECYAVVDR